MRLLIFTVIGCATLCIGFGTVASHHAVAQETFSGQSTTNPNGESFNGGNSAPTGTQGVEGNPFCPPPKIVVNGLPTTPLNWSCGQNGGTQTQQWVPVQKSACDETGADWDPVACDRQRCDHNPDLMVCSQFNRPAPPGSKNIVRTPPNSQNAQPPPLNFPVIEVTMSRCLHSELNYIPVQMLQTQYKIEARRRMAVSAPITTPFTELPAASQIALAEIAMALQVQALHDSRYGAPVHWDSYNQPVEFLAGWLDHCLGNAGLVSTAPKLDPRIRFGAFLGIPVHAGGGLITDDRLNAFSQGYSLDVVPPLSLTPP